METDFDAIIIGAGPAGSSAAILLVRHGWRVALVEKQTFPRRKVCGGCIAASNLPLLDSLGIGEAFHSLAGPPLRQAALMSGSQVIRANFPPFAHTVHHWGVALSREHLDTLLLDQARRCGVTVLQPWANRKLQSTPGGFLCHVRKVHTEENKVLNAPILIDAHGSWEAGPMTADIESLPQPAHRPSDLFAFKANFLRAPLENGLLPVLSFPGGYGGMVIGNHGVATLAFCMRRDTLTRCRKALPGQGAAEAAAAYVANACKGVRLMLRGAEQQGAWLSAGPIRPGIRILIKGKQEVRPFLIGNAAGEAHPIIGEGISMAIQSAWLLADMLGPYKRQASDHKQQTWLQEQHARAWQRHFAPRIRLAALFAHIAMRPLPAACALQMLKRYPQLLANAVRWSGKIDCAPLSEAFDAARYTPGSPAVPKENQPRGHP